MNPISDNYLWYMISWAVSIIAIWVVPMSNTMFYIFGGAGLAFPILAIREVIN